MIKSGDMATLTKYNSFTGKFEQSDPVRVKAVNRLKGIAYIEGSPFPLDIGILNKIQENKIEPR